MARPNKKGLDYFPLDIDFFEDEKIGAISGEFGIKGEITAIKLLCAVYRNGYFAVWNEPLKIKLLKSLPGINAELLEQIVNRLVRWGFFDSSCFNSDKILTSEGIQKRYFQISKRRKLKEEYPYLLINVDNNPINVYNNQVNVYKSTQRKEKKINNPPIIPPYDFSDDGMRPIHEIKKTIFESEQVWMETVAMNKRLKPNEIVSFINSFSSYLECTGEKMKSLKDFKSHFFRWLNKQTINRKEAEDERAF